MFEIFEVIEREIIQQEVRSLLLKEEEWIYIIEQTDT